jgi:hypothetical protein
MGRGRARILASSLVLRSDADRDYRCIVALVMLIGMATASLAAATSAVHREGVVETHSVFAN